jgi:hypothetical protein
LGAGVLLTQADKKKIELVPFRRRNQQIRLSRLVGHRLDGHQFLFTLRVLSLKVFGVSDYD